MRLPQKSVTASDVARIFEVSERRVYRWINDGTIRPAGQVGRIYYFKLEDIQEACRENKLK